MQRALQLYQTWNPRAHIMTAELSEELMQLPERIVEKNTLESYIRHHTDEYPLLCALILDPSESAAICTTWNNNIRLEPTWATQLRKHAEKTIYPEEMLKIHAWIGASGGTLSMIGLPPRMWITNDWPLHDFLEKPHSFLSEPEHPKSSHKHIEWIFDCWESAFGALSVTMDNYIPLAPPWVWHVVAAVGTLKEQTWRDMLYSDASLSKLALYPNAYAAVTAATLRQLSRGKPSHQDGSRKCDIRNIVKELCAKNPTWIQNADPEIQHYLLATLVHVWPIAYPPYNNMFINHEAAWTKYRTSWEDVYNIMQGINIVPELDDHPTPQTWLELYQRMYMFMHKHTKISEIAVDDLFQDHVNGISDD